MIPDFQKIKSELTELLHSRFLKELEIGTESVLTFIKDVKSDRKNLFYKEDQYGKNKAALTKQSDLDLHKIIVEKFPRQEPIDLERQFPILLSEIEKLISEYPDKITIEQKKERFFSQPANGSIIKYLKFWKRNFYRISTLPKRTWNGLRSLFKKEKREVKFWNHTIPFTGLANFYLIDKLFQELLPVYDELNKEINSALVKLWRLDQEAENSFSDDKNDEILKSFSKDVHEIIDYLESEKRSLKGKTDEKIEKVIKEFEDSFYKAGTLELRSRHFDQKHKRKNREETNEEYSELDEGWNVSRYLLAMDWSQDLQIQILRLTITEDYIELREKASSIVESEILPGIKEVKEILERSKSKIGDLHDNELIERLKDIKQVLNSQLTEKLIPKISDSLLSNNLYTVLDEFEYKFNNYVSEMPEEEVVGKSYDYTVRIKSSQIDSLSPKELIKFEIAPDFNEASQEVKKEIFSRISKVQNGIYDVEQISDFSLESALAFDKQDDLKEKGPKGIAGKGLDRTIEKLNSLEESITEIKDQFEEEFDNAVKKLIENLLELTETEKVLNLKLRIVKAKALERAKEARQELIKNIKNILPVIGKKFLAGFQYVKDKYKQITKRFGLDVEKTQISSALSDFLSETESAVEKLPFVYQRLFKIEPLSNERLYEIRAGEYDRLMLAYKNWVKGRFAPVLIVGEKGGGITTFLNLSTKKLVEKYEFYRGSIKKGSYTEEYFYNYFKDLLGKNDIENIDDLVDHLNSFPEKEIIVIEDLQHLYLKKVNGFNCLRMLFELISATNKKIFWITTINRYSFEYLNKTISLSDHFGYLIELQEMNDKQIIDIIDKRHRVSGYQIVFEGDENQALSKSEEKLSEEEIQGLRKKEYFSNLNKFAKSNLSLALIYWLRSTKSIKGNTITMSPISKFDVSFLSFLSEDKIFILSSLLLHDGLDVKSLSLVTGYSQDKCRLILTQLVDDGIVLKKPEFYIINPLLYRQVVYQLEAKNILH